MGPFALLNYTGRIFMCISHEEQDDSVEYWSENFTKGMSYHEALRDTVGLNRTKEFEGILLLYGDNNYPIYVDSRCFIEVEKDNTILLGKILCLN